jgi:hypothetical protein
MPESAQIASSILQSRKISDAKLALRIWQTPSLSPKPKLTPQTNPVRDRADTSALSARSMGTLSNAAQRPLVYCSDLKHLRNSMAKNWVRSS